MVTVTNSLLEQGISVNGSWSRKQLEALQVPIGKGFKLKKGWKRRLIDSEITEQQKDRFLALKDAHVKTPENDANTLLEPALQRFTDQQITDFCEKIENLHLSCRTDGKLLFDAVQIIKQLQAGTTDQENENMSERLSKEQFVEHLKLNCGDYSSMVSISILYNALYGEYPRIGMSGQQNEFAKSMEGTLPVVDILQLILMTERTNNMSAKEETTEQVRQAVAMKVAHGETGLKCSHQGDFPPKATCICGGEGRIAFVAYEKGGVEGASYICDMHKNQEGGMWVHDAVAVAVYLCRKCLKPVAICNQG